MHPETVANQEQLKNVKKDEKPRRLDELVGDPPDNLEDDDPQYTCTTEQPPAVKGTPVLPPLEPEPPPPADPKKHDPRPKKS